MKARFEPIELPPWTAFWLRLARRLAWTAAFLLVGFFLLEGVAYLLFRSRSTRFLVEGESNGQPAWIDNQFFPYRFFSERVARAPLPIVALKTPAPGTLRVCLLGGSEAMGAPDPSFGLGRQLELMLQSRYPGHPVEVIPMTFEGGNSHVLREVARDLKRLQPNAVILLTGNDEIAGPYGPASGLGQFQHSSAFIRPMVLFSRTRLSQLLIAGVQWLFPDRADLQAWRIQQPIKLKGRMNPQDPRLKTARRMFRDNLTAILQEATEASPVVLACTIPVNLRDCSPFYTSYLKDETAAQQARETLRAAIAAELATNRFEASRLYVDVLRINPTHAEALFRVARLSLEDNRPVDADTLFSRARDADALRLRADSQLNDIIRDSASDPSVSLFDAEKLFASQSPQGIPGRELFLNHVLFTFEANYLLASSLLGRMEFLRAFEPEPNGAVPRIDDIASDLLYEPWGHAAQLDEVIHQHLHPPFRRQIDNADTLARLNEQRRLLDERIAAKSPEITRAIFARKQRSRPNDARLAARAARVLLKGGDPNRAEVAAYTAYVHWPHRFDIRALLALICTVQGQPPSDGIAFLCGANTDCGYYDITASIEIGRFLMDIQRNAEAQSWLEYALERDQWNSEATVSLAQALHNLDQTPQAIKLLQEAIERNPKTPLLWEELASQYCFLNDFDRAAGCFRKSEAIAPYRYQRLLKLAQILFRLKQYPRAKGPIERYLVAMPDDPTALALQEDIIANLPAEPEPIPEPTEEKPAQKFPWE